VVGVLCFGVGVVVVVVVVVVIGVLYAFEVLVGIVELVLVVFGEGFVVFL